MLQKRDRTDNFFVFLILSVYPIFSQYYFKSIPVSLADAVLVLVILSLGVLKRGLYINKKLIGIGASLSVWNLIIGFQYGTISNTIHNCMSILLFFGVMSLIWGSVKPDVYKMYKFLRVTAFVATVFLLFQLILHERSGVSLYGYIPILKNNFVVDNDLVFLMIDYGRPTSFFYEPAHYCIFIAPILMLSLHFKDYIISGICAIGLAFSTSSTGYAVLLIVAAIFLFEIVQSNWKYVGIILLVITAVIIVNFSSLDLSKFTWQNMLENIRLFKPFEYYKSFSFTDILLGIGHNKLEFWGEMHGLRISNYTNSFLFFVMSFGIVGFIAMCVFIRCILNKQIFWRPISIIVLFLLLSDQLLFNRNFAFLLICIFFSQSIAFGGEKDEFVNSNTGI